MQYRRSNLEIHNQGKSIHDGMLSSATSDNQDLGPVRDIAISHNY